MNRFSIAASRVLISVLSLVLAACTHALVGVPSVESASRQKAR